MQLIMALSGFTAGAPADVKSKTAAVRAAASLVSVGSSPEHTKMLGENGHARLELAADSPALGGALAKLESGKRYRVTIEEIK